MTLHHHTHSLYDSHGWRLWVLVSRLLQDKRSGLDLEVLSLCRGLQLKVFMYLSDERLYNAATHHLQP